MAAEGIVFAIAVEPLAVFVTFVGGDHDCGARMANITQCLDHMDGAHDICLPCLDGNLVGKPDERLCGEVEYKVGPGRIHRSGDGDGVADVTTDVAETGGQFDLLKQGGGGGDADAKARDFRAELDEPFGEPGPLNPVWPVTSTRRPL